MNDIQNKKEQLSDLISEGIKKWVQAGELLVQMIDLDGVSVPELADEIGLNANILYRFEQLGRKQVMPYLLLADFPASSRIIKLPYSEQKRLEKGSVTLLIEKDEGLDQLNVPAKNLTPEQCKQVFSGGKIRDAGEQRAWLIGETKKAKLKILTDQVGSHSQPYDLTKKGSVIFTRPCELTRKEVLRLLEDMD